MSIWPARVKSGTDRDRRPICCCRARAVSGPDFRCPSAARRVSYILLIVGRGPEQAFEEAAVLALARQILRIIAGIRIGFGIGYSAAIAWVDRLA